jgi:hypothetical protein
MYAARTRTQNVPIGYAFARSKLASCREGRTDPKSACADSQTIGHRSARELMQWSPDIGSPLRSCITVRVSVPNARPNTHGSVRWHG